MQGIWVLAFTLQWVLVLLLVLVTAGVLRYLASIQERLDLAAPHISKYELGERIDDFSLRSMGGGMVARDDVARLGLPALFLLVQAGCGSCVTLMMQVAELGRRPGGWRTLEWSPVFVCAGEPSAIEQMAMETEVADLEGVTLLVDEDWEVPRQWGVRNAPTGIAADSRGVVRAQSFNPHQNWLYKVLDVLPPVTPIVRDKNSGDAMRSPLGFEEVSAQLARTVHDRRGEAVR